MTPPTIEHSRLTDRERARWARWGSYLAARAWGTVRESAPGELNPWEAFPWAQAGSRSYRWTEDGIAGFCDDQQRVCLSLALWNERDPCLKERFFGLSNSEGNHGEDVKEYFFYLDALPSGAYLRMLYKYPQAEFPYDRLRQENALRGQDQPPFNLIDALPRTFAERRYFDIVIEYAKADSEDILCRVTATNHGPDPAPLHVVPRIWFARSLDEEAASGDPALIAEAAEPGDTWASAIARHPELGARRWSVEGPGGLLFADNASDLAALYDQPTPGGAKNAIDQSVVRGRHEALNREPRGTLCAAHRRAMIAPGQSWSVRLRFRPAGSGEPADDIDATFAKRAAEADAFYAAVQRPEHDTEARAIQRAAFAGLNWNKIAYRFAVGPWLDGATGRHATSEARAAGDAHAGWRHFAACDVISVADPWEFPFLATWDLDFQLITLGLIDPVFAKQQAILLLSDRYQRSDGAIPATEGAFETPHPPLHAWAVWHIYQLSGCDRAFLAAAYPGLKRHFEWWLRTQRQPGGSFGGGFLGMDNISLLDRNDIPAGHRLAQADGTGWMAHCALMLLAQAIELGRDDDSAAFLAEFATIRRALASLWDGESRFFYDTLIAADGRRTPLPVRSLVGLVPLLATQILDAESLAGLPRLRATLADLRRTESGWEPNANGQYLLSAAAEHIDDLLAVILDPSEFWGPYGVRSVSQRHAAAPVELEIAGEPRRLEYEPGDARDRMFGGNSNWRGPVWAPLNHLVVEALHTLHTYGVPSAAGKAEELAARLIGIFKQDSDGRRPLFGGQQLFQRDPAWRDQFWFYEHFHAETGAGLGASHQNGWTALIARLLHDGGYAVFIPRAPHAASEENPSPGVNDALIAAQPIT